MVGLDVCRGRWVGFDSDRRGFLGETIEAVLAAVEADSPVAVVGIDIPIGIASGGERKADRLARGLVGRRSSSVFTTPVRAALDAATHTEATALNRAATGKGISQQAFGLRHKILEVDAWLRGTDRVVVEVHPEVSFATMAGRPLEHRKTSWAGGEERRTLLRAVGLDPVGDLGPMGAYAAVDDVLDAAAACWTASRFARGIARPYPEVPEDVGPGPAAAIWA